MYRKAVLAGGALLAIAGCAPAFFSRTPQSAFGPQQGCPRADLGETEQDCPWAGWVREFERQSALSEALPEAIRVSLERDQADSAIREAWGLSQNYDEGVRAEIVRGPILEALAARMGVEVQQKRDRRVVHAGLIHTYGYLLSNLRTSFGYKRARWVSGRIEAGLRIPRESFGPGAYLLGPETTLLSQATFFMMRVALRDDAARWEEWRPRLEGRTTEALRALRLPAIARSSESQTLPSGERVEWVTDLVYLPADPRGGRLLVYSQHTAQGVRLITAFPVEANFSEKKNTPVRPRYNAWVD